MQFKYPELLWALLLLLIPIIIHLFQLRRFKKTPFTNVRLLQMVVAQTRKSQSVKKWLLLFTRILLFTCIILAFARPFFAAENALVEKETAIYLDDSFSMQAKTENGDLLQLAIQDLIKGLAPEGKISLFTNERTFSSVTPSDIQNELLSMSQSYKQLNLDEILLKAQALFNESGATKNQLIVISDFQEQMYEWGDDVPDMDLHFVRLRPENTQNIALDSVFVSNSSPTQLDLTAVITSVGEVENSPVSIWDADTLIAKTAAKFDPNGRAEVVFSLPQDMVVDGKIEIADGGLSYDNQLYFNINPKEKIKVMLIGEGPDNYFRRIYVDNEFQLESYGIANLNYSAIDNKNLIILNQLESIPNSLDNALDSFISAGGSLVVIPAQNADLLSYNALLGAYFNSNISDLQRTEQEITTITFDHPVYQNVFENTVRNFQYPSVSSYYRLKTRAPALLRFQSGDPFLVGDQRIYIFAAPIDPQNSNFTSSPLIVPSLYNIGAFSLKLPALYHPLSSNTNIDIPVALPSDAVARVTRDDYEFIPLQQSFANKTTLDFEEHPSEDGIFNIVLEDSLISRISFNYPRDESDLVYANLEDAPVTSIQGDIPELLETIEKDSSIEELWQWFVILALLFIIAEVLVQKLFK